MAGAPKVPVIIVGRAHAGVGSYYGAFDTQAIFGGFKREELGVTPLFFDNAFYCRCCGAVATPKSCPHGKSERVVFSSTQLRGMFRAGREPPSEFTRPRVAQVLMEAMARESSSS